jgi:hypothetical protein
MLEGEELSGCALEQARPLILIVSYQEVMRCYNISCVVNAYIWLETNLLKDENISSYR